MSKEYNKIEVKDNMKVDNSDGEKVEKTVEKEHMEKVVNLQPTKVKKSLVGRLFSGIVGPDGLPGIGSYVNEEIVKPAIKNIIVDAVTSGINMVMYGDKGPATGGRSRYGSPSRSNYTPRTNYGSNYRGSRDIAEPLNERTVRHSKHGVDEYVIGDRHDASQVLISLTEYADRYDAVSIADYYDLIGVASKYTDNNFGWSASSIAMASIIPVRGGFIIKFPPVEVI